MKRYNDQIGRIFKYKIIVPKTIPYFQFNKKRNLNFALTIKASRFVLNLSAYYY